MFSCPFLIGNRWVVLHYDLSCLKIRDVIKWCIKFLLNFIIRWKMMYLARGHRQTIHLMTDELDHHTPCSLVFQVFFWILLYVYMHIKENFLIKILFLFWGEKRIVLLLELLFIHCYNWNWKGYFFPIFLFFTYDIFPSLRRQEI